jgi:predicted nucleotidyltransferase
MSLVDSLGPNFEPLISDVQDIIERSFILPLRHRITEVKLDLALGLSGFEQRAVERAQRVEFGGVQVSMIRPEDLLIMKVLAGRPRDDQDATGIVAQRRDLDWDYCLDIATQLGEAIGQDLASRLKALRASRIELT